MWYCDTDEMKAIPTDKVIMRHADDEVFRLVEKLQPKIEAMDEGEITLRVKHGWVASIGIFIVEVCKKLRTVE